MNSRGGAGGSQHQSTTLSIALNLTSLPHQASPGTCRWHSGCRLYEADTQIEQEPATHLVPNFSRKRLVTLYGGYFCTKEFQLSDARSRGTGGLQKQERLEAPMDLEQMQALPAGVACELCWTFFFSFLFFFFFLNHNLQHRVAELALKEVFGASVLTHSQDCQYIFFCVPESETQMTSGEHCDCLSRVFFYFILFHFVFQGMLLTTIWPC